MRTLYQPLMQDKSLFVDLVGVPVEFFEELFAAFYSEWIQQERTRLNAKMRLRRIGGGRKYTTSLKDRLLLVFLWKRYLLSTASLGELFDVHPSTASRYRSQMIACLDEVESFQTAVSFQQKINSIEELNRKFPRLRTLLEKVKSS